MSARATRGPQRGAGRRPSNYRGGGGGGGGGKSTSGCAVVALAAAGAVLGALGAIGYAAAHLASWL